MIYVTNQVRSLTLTNPLFYLVEMFLITSKMILEAFFLFLISNLTQSTWVTHLSLTTKIETEPMHLLKKISCQIYYC